MEIRESILAFYQKDDRESNYEKRWGYGNPVSAAYWSLRNTKLYEALAGLSIPASRTNHVLEIGSGFGHELIKMASINIPVNKLIGIDLVPERLMKAKRIYGGNMQLHVQDAAYLAFKNESIDIVLQFTCIFHMEWANRRKIYAEINRVLKPGGTLIWWDITPKRWLTERLVILCNLLGKPDRLRRLPVFLLSFTAELFSRKKREQTLHNLPDHVHPISEQEIIFAFKGYKINLLKMGLDYAIWNFVWKRSRWLAHILWIKSWFYQHCFGIIVKPVAKSFTA